MSKCQCSVLSFSPPSMLFQGFFSTFHTFNSFASLEKSGLEQLLVSGCRVRCCCRFFVVASTHGELFRNALRSHLDSNKFIRSWKFFLFVFSSRFSIQFKIQRFSITATATRKMYVCIQKKIGAKKKVHCARCSGYSKRREGRMLLFEKIPKVRKRRMDKKKSKTFWAVVVWASHLICYFSPLSQSSLRRSITNISIGNWASLLLMIMW